MSWQSGVWRKGKRTLRGRWCYIWHRDRFLIELDGKDRATGLSRRPFEVTDDVPNFNGWKLERESTIGEKSA